MTGPGAAAPPVPCRLYLAVTAGLAAKKLAMALEGGDIACVLLRAGALDDTALGAAIETLRPLAQERKAAFLVEDRVRLAAAHGCDGVHLSDPAAYRAARARLGPGDIVGVACGDSRDDAMTVAEQGADYVAFGCPGPGAAAPPGELLNWWQAFVTVPCVALGARAAADCAALAAAGADFVAVEDALWAPSPDPAGALGEIARAIARGGAS